MLLSTSHDEEFQGEEQRGGIRVNVLWSFHLSIAVPDNQMSKTLLGAFIHLFD